jgi:hypothetical protein
MPTRPGARRIPGFALLIAALAAVGSGALAGCGEDGLEPVGRREFAYQRSHPEGSGPWDYYLTCYGGPSDGSAYQGTPACGGQVVDGNWWYSTGAAAFGCHAKLAISTADGSKCVVVEVVDNGPADWVEDRAGLPIIDASPLVTEALFGLSCAGWSDRLAISVSEVDGSTPTGPCAAAPEPQPDPEPVPDPQPDPDPQPAPGPDPAAEPDPGTDPGSEPAPAPSPGTAPGPAPAPAPGPGSQGSDGGAGDGSPAEPGQPGPAPTSAGGPYPPASGFASSGFTGGCNALPLDVGRGSSAPALPDGAALLLSLLGAALALTVRRPRRR